MRPPCPPGYVDTRDALHRVARFGLVPFRWRVDDETWIEPSPGGFGTPMLADGSRARVEGVELSVETDGARSVEPLTTLRSALALLGVEAVSTLEQPDIPGIGDLEQPLAVEPMAAAFLADWFALGWDVLGELRSDVASTDGGELRLWTHHFDPAFECLSEAEGRRATYGLSPGDRGVREPYAYVAPWAPDRVSEQEFWNATTFRGAILPWSQLGGREDVLAFLRRGRDLLASIG